MRSTNTYISTVTNGMVINGMREGVHLTHEMSVKIYENDLCESIYYFYKNGNIRVMMLEMFRINGPMYVFNVDGTMKSEKHETHID